MCSNSELANSWNIKQNSTEKNDEIDCEESVTEHNSDEHSTSKKSLTKYIYC